MNALKNIKRNSKRAFTLAEILLVLFIIGVVSVPFANMFLFGVKGSNENAEHIMAYNLAREKLEEIRSVPFDLVQSDYEVFRDVFQDRYKYDDAYYNEDQFVLYFTDVFTENSIKVNEINTTYKKLKELYPKTYLKPLPLYPSDYSNFRRVVTVESMTESASPAKLKKVNVKIYNEQNKTFANLSTMIGQH